MDRVPVASRNLAAVAYDGEAATLEIEFRNGYVYQYYLVPPDVYRALMNAPSKGSYFTRRIKDHFPTKQVR